MYPSVFLCYIGEFYQTHFFYMPIESLKMFCYKMFPSLSGTIVYVIDKYKIHKIQNF